MSHVFAANITVIDEAEYFFKSIDSEYNTNLNDAHTELIRLIDSLGLGIKDVATAFDLYDCYELNILYSETVEQIFDTLYYLIHSICTEVESKTGLCIDLIPDDGDYDDSYIWQIHNAFFTVMNPKAEKYKNNFSEVQVIHYE